MEGNHTLSRERKYTQRATVFICALLYLHYLFVASVYVYISIYEPRHEKTNILHMRKQRRRRRSASR